MALKIVPSQEFWLISANLLLKPELIYFWKYLVIVVYCKSMYNIFRKLAEYCAYFMA